MKKLCFLVLAVCLGVVGMSAPAHAEETGRWKLGSQGCYWDPNDDGPDQCSPDQGSGGRFKWTSNGACYWDANDSGPNQCDPTSSQVTDLPPGTVVPTNDQEPPPLQTVDGGMGGVVGPEPSPWCTSQTKHGNVGYISLELRPDGGLLWGAYMDKWWENYGLWVAGIYVDGTQVDFKHQLYPPHASVGPVQARHGGLLTILVSHSYFATSIVWTYDPWENVYQPTIYWGPQMAYGYLICRLP